MNNLYYSYTFHTIPINNFNPQFRVKLNKSFTISDTDSEGGVNYYTNIYVFVIKKNMTIIKNTNYEHLAIVNPNSSYSMYIKNTKTIPNPPDYKVIVIILSIVVPIVLLFWIYIFICCFCCRGKENKQIEEIKEKDDNALELTPDSLTKETLE